MLNPKNIKRVAAGLGMLVALCLSGVAAQAATLTGSFASISRGAVVNLTAEGALDWVHWGAFTETSLDRKANVTPQISDFTLAFPSNLFAFAYQFADNWNGYSWSDGTPDPEITDTTTGVYVVGMNHGFEFTVPAGTSVKTLKVYVGAYGASGRFQATLSDNGAPAYTDASLTNPANGPAGVYTITFAGRSPGSRLTIKWTVASMIDPSAGNVTLQSAALTATNANNPPFVELTNPADNATFNAGGNITLTASAVDFDGTISKVEFFQDALKLGEDMNNPYNFTWNKVPAGHYYLYAHATDNQGEVSSSEPVEIFVNTTGGSLSGGVSKPPSLAASANLTIEGTADWAHWGLDTATSLDRKTGVIHQISDFTAIGDHMVDRYADNYTAFSWSDGTPTGSATNTPTGVFIPGLTNGFELVAAADTTTRTLKIYVGLFAARGKFRAWLSDFSAKAYTDTSLSNFFDNAYAAYTLNYAAASSGQILHVRYTAREIYDFDYGNVTLQSATLVGPAVTNASPSPVTLADPRWVSGSFAFSFVSQLGVTYSIQYAPTLPSATWQALTTVTGNGSTLNVTNRNPSSAARFYRVQSN